MQGRLCRARRAALICGAAGLCAVAAGPAAATPYDNIPVADPIEQEIRILDLFDSRGLHGRIRLPHLATLPLQPIELQGLGQPYDDVNPVTGIALARLERVLGRDRSPLFAPHPTYTSTPRLFDSSSEKTLLQVSTTIEGLAEREEGDSHIASGSGFHGRIGLGLDRLLAFTHYVVGRFDNAQEFANPIVPSNDIIVLPEEAFISYTEERGQWGLQFGRNRWHWGPSDEGSLVLSRTSAPLTGLAFRAHHQALRADGIALSATLSDAADEQLAAHRIEWQLQDGLRAGITEAARYHAPGWEPLYLIGIIPYVLVQRLQVQAEPDSADVLRNNVVMSFDVAWRVVNGHRVYGELLIDDLHTSGAESPNKYGYQAGYEGAALLGGSRLTWGTEYTRVSRYVYTSFFGRSYVAQGAPIGFPLGPDSRRVRLKVGLDATTDWTMFATATHDDKGENDLDEPYVPGSGAVDASTFEGVVETTNQVEVGARWWPASGVYLAMSAGYREIDNYTHVEGRGHRTAIARIEVRIGR
jgi:hypothetical protein